MSESNSRPVISNQSGPHPDLAKTVRRHLESAFLKPIGAMNRDAYAMALNVWQSRCPDAPLILDSGCGTGESTLHLAQRFPESFVLGVDQSEHRLKSAMRRAIPGRGETAANWIFIRADLVDFWRLLVADEIRLQRHFLLYPNPWPKSEHLKRRWHGHPVFPALLALGGILECRSNWRPYVEELADTLELATDHRPTIERCFPENTAWTPFERKYHASGHALWRIQTSLPETTFHARKIAPLPQAGVQDVPALNSGRGEPFLAPLPLVGEGLGRG